MSAPQQLTELQRNRLQTAHHSLPRREMVRYWLLSTDDIRRINERRREHNRLGFAVQLCLLRYPGWPLKVGKKPPSNLLEFVAQQIDADPDEFGDYAAREQTRQEHQSPSPRTTGKDDRLRGAGSELSAQTLSSATGQ